MDELLARVQYAVLNITLPHEQVVVQRHFFGDMDYDEVLHIDEGVFSVLLQVGERSEAVWRNPVTNELEFCG